jgi:hypothetical protein
MNNINNPYRNNSENEVSLFLLLYYNFQKKIRNINNY